MTVASAEWASFWVQVAYTLVTIGILVAAIWGDYLRGKFYGPRVILALHDPQGHLTQAQNTVPVRYFHLKVQNARSRVPARIVRVLCTGVSKGPSHVKLQPLGLPVPLQLTWSFPKFHALTPTIANEDTCDFGFLAKKDDRFRLAVYVQPACPDTSVKAGETAEFTVEVDAENCPSASSIRLRVSWDGEWHDDNEIMARHLVVTVIGHEGNAENTGR
jgi:hypothetical protein